MLVKSGGGGGGGHQHLKLMKSVSAFLWSLSIIR